MKNVPEPLEFEWNRGNLNKSRHKHNVFKDEAESVFLNKDSVVLPDQEHSLTEERFVIIGKSNNERHLFISFTLRKNKVRIISARRMHKKEVEKYEKTKENF
jgi:uncharacterized DUF497 family protein